MEGVGKVRWAFDQHAIANSFASDGSSPSVSSESNSTSTVAFVNNQLINHGFVRAPGLPLESLSTKDQDTAAKCLMGMLGQRMDDVARADEVATKLRTLTYDFERLSSFNKALEDKVVHAEREAELFRSKMNAASKHQAAAESAHKQTNAQLSKARTDLQYARSTAQNEIKRKEKEVERILERWTKICNEQARLGSVGTGMVCANLAIVEGEKGPLGDSVMERAMSDLETSRARLVEENDAFRDVVLSAARGLQSLINELDPSLTEPPPLLTAAQLFASPATGPTATVASLYDPSAHAITAHLKMKDMMAAVRQRVEDMEVKLAERTALKEKERMLEQEMEERKAAMRELEVVRGVVDELKDEIARQTMSSEEQKNAFEKLLSDEDFLQGLAKKAAAQAKANESTDSIVLATAADLEAREEALKREQAEFAEAAARLDEERAALEAERQQLSEEKHHFNAQRLLSQQPDSPELRHERDMVEGLSSGSRKSLDGELEPSAGRVHHVRRSRNSLGVPSADALPEPSVPASKAGGKKKAVGFQPGQEDHIGALKSPPPTEPEPEPKDDVPPPRKSKATTPPQNKTTSTNPFEAVLRSSAQRPRPVFTGNGLPSFQPVGALPVGPVDSTIPPTKSGTASSSSGKSNSSSKDDRSKSRQPKQGTTLKRSPPTKPSGNPTQITPPIFTHRRIVGKKHQYAPAVPSPLSKMMRRADSSTESPDGLQNSLNRGREDNSFSPSTSALAAVVASGGRSNGGIAAATAASIAAAFKSVPPLDFGPRSGSPGDDDGEWVNEEDGGEQNIPGPSFARPPSETPPSPPPLVQRNLAPLTEDELTMEPKSKPPVSRPGAVRKPSLSSKPPVRPPMNALLKTKAVKSSVAPSTSSTKPVAGAQQKEKENVPTVARASSRVPTRPVSTNSPVKAVAGKVVMGKSTSRSTIASLAAKIEKKGVVPKPARSLVKPKALPSRSAQPAVASKK
ncbi:hypothetical protein FRC04_008115 [Tulasnella sp. 424]|nr:hypothetical protein FRC04_008115 [Tulasnella sp. 424]KAG8974772.1 hypothetical protein FRC05_006933 [Tulasnella sp. 425]